MTKDNVNSIKKKEYELRNDKNKHAKVNGVCKNIKNNYDLSQQIILVLNDLTIQMKSRLTKTLQILTPNGEAKTCM